MGITGFSKALETKQIVLTELKRNKNINTVEVDIKGYEQILVVLYPPKDGTSSTADEPGKIYRSGDDASNAYKDNILIINPQVK